MRKALQKAQELEQQAEASLQGENEKEPRRRAIQEKLGVLKQEEPRYRELEERRQEGEKAAASWQSADKTQKEWEQKRDELQKTQEEEKKRLLDLGNPRPKSAAWKRKKKPPPSSGNGSNPCSSGTPIIERPPKPIRRTGKRWKNSKMKTKNIPPGVTNWWGCSQGLPRNGPSMPVYSKKKRRWARKQRALKRRKQPLSSRRRTMKTLTAPYRN